MSRIHSIRALSNYAKIIFPVICFFLLFSFKPIDDQDSKKMQYAPVLVIHGGAGTINKDDLTAEEEMEYRAALQLALESGYAILKQGGTSIDAVIAAIQVMEESPLFNAGVGAVLTWEGTNELDASIMDGKSGMAGAVAGVSRIKSPIEAAYRVMTNSPHVMLTGRGAEEFAEQNGLEMVDTGYFRTKERYLQNIRLKEFEKMKADTGTSSSVFRNRHFGTVGAVALDSYGNLAAGTSTGGMANKRYGRIGDSPVIGAGTYADNQTCAVSATGHGEFFIRNVVAYDIAARMKYQNKDLKTAADEVINELKVKGGFGGVICLDRKGNIAMPFNTSGMYRGYIMEDGKTNIQIYND